MTRKLWMREELMLAINLYLKTPFGRIHNRNPEIINLAQLINRTPSAVAWKMSNFANIDPTLDRKGAEHCSKLDREVWSEFHADWETLIIQSEKLLQDYSNQHDEYPFKDLSKSQLINANNTDREQTVKVRFRQNLFRRLILSSYNNKCCITGIDLPELLIASHIKPWSLDRENRLNPCNGLCLNNLHDKAFDRGLITISENYQIILSSKLMKSNDVLKNFFQQYQNKIITLPSRFLPSLDFLRYHREHIFVD